MILAAGTMAACLVTVWLLRRHTVWVLGLIVALYVGIPGQADGVIVPFLHPGTYLTFALVGQHLLVRDRDEMANLLRPLVPAMIGFSALMALGMLDLLNPYKSDVQAVGSTLIRVFLAAALLLPLTFAELRRRPQSVATLRRILIGIGVVQVAIAIGQHQTAMESFVFWRSYYELSYWWREGFPVPLGTTGHPLQMAAYLSMCIPLLARMRSPIVAVAVSGFFLYGAALATGRASTAMAAVGVVFVLIWHGRKWYAAGAAAVMAGFMGVRLWQSEGLKVLRAKIDDDQGSSALRRQALEWAIEHMDEFAWYGYPGGHDLRGTGILSSSLENGYLIAGLSFGMLFAVALLALHLYVMLAPLAQSLTSMPEVLATAFVWVGFFASSSFMAFAIDGRAFWLLAGMAWAVAAPSLGSIRDIQDVAVEQPDQSRSPSGVGVVT